MSNFIITYLDGYQAVLFHHGIKGQKWGNRNGPPYPLDREDYSTLEKRKESFTQKGLTEKQKKIIKIGAVAVGSALAVYGGYKLSKFLKMKNAGIITGMDDLEGKIIEGTETFRSGLSIREINPFKHGNKEERGNCTSSSTAAVLNDLFGVKAKAKSGTELVDDNGNDFKDPMTYVGLIEKMFPELQKHTQGTAGDFARSYDNAAKKLKDLYGNNAAGTIVMRQKNKTYNHVFNWKTINGNVKFYDSQNGVENANEWFNAGTFDPQRLLMITRLDNTRPKLDLIKKFVTLL